MTPHPSLRSLYKPYLASLWLLEIALVWHALPAISRKLQALLPIGTATEPLMRAMQVMLASSVVVALTACLALPVVAAMLHGRLGRRTDDLHAGRRDGADSMPIASAGIALAGAILFVVGTVIEFAAPRVAWLELPPGVPAPAIVMVGMVLMTAGALGTEILCRRHGDRMGDEGSRTSPPVRRRHLGGAVATTD